MKKYKLVYQAKVTVEVEASNDEAAINKAEKETLKIGRENKIFLAPTNEKFELNEIE
jgi:hypothetical protein